MSKKMSEHTHVEECKTNMRRKKLRRLGYWTVANTKRSRIPYLQVLSNLATEKGFNAGFHSAASTFDHDGEETRKCFSLAEGPTGSWTKRE